MTDIVERLQCVATEAADEIERLQSCLYAQEAVKPLYDEIERLRAENKRLQKLTITIIDRWRAYCGITTPAPTED